VERDCEERRGTPEEWWRWPFFCLQQVAPLAIRKLPDSVGAVAGSTTAHDLHENLGGEFYAIVVFPF
jgi:hypothetical protein